jgi:hypothetical protein
LADPPVEQLCGINAVHDLGAIPSGTTLDPLDTITFITTSDLDNDGNLDFGIKVLAATSVGGEDYLPFFFPDTQEVEVQPCGAPTTGQLVPERETSVCLASPEPSTLGSSLSGFWAVILMCMSMRRLRRRTAVPGSEQGEAVGRNARI